jgi:hypothetical protein
METQTVNQNINLRDIYYSTGLRVALEHVLKEPKMSFISQAVGLLDKLMKAHVLEHAVCVVSEGRFENYICINHERYSLPDGKWQNIFFDLMEDEGGSGNNIKNKKIAFDTLFSLCEVLVADLLHPKSLPAIISKKGSLLSIASDANYTKGSINQKKEKNVDSVIDRQALAFITSIVQVIYKENLFGLNVPGDLLEEPEEYRERATKKVLAQKLITIIETSYLNSGKKYNENNQGADSLIRLPFTSLANSFGTCLVHQLFLPDVNKLQNLLDETKNPTILEWIKTLSLFSVKKPKKVKEGKVEKGIELGFLEGRNFSDKDVQFIIKYLCVLFYDNFFAVPDNLIKKPFIFQLLSKHIGGDISRLRTSVERRLIKVGVVMIGLFIKQGVFAGTMLMPSMDVMHKQTRLKKIGPFETVRVVNIAPTIADALLTTANMERPYLIDKNRKRPVSESYFTVTDQIEHIYDTYRSQLDNKIHDNENSQCIINDFTISNHKTRFIIDQAALLTLLNLIHKGLTIPLTIFTYTEISCKAFLTLFDITEEQITALRNSMDVHSIRLNDFFVYLTNFSSTHIDAKELIRAIEAYPVSQTNKDCLKRLVEKATGLKQSLIALICEAIIYSYFQHFTITSFLDTRGRRYYKNTSLNIQAFVLVKSLVKIYTKPLSHETLEKEFGQISEIFCKYLNSPEITKLIHSQNIRDRWLTKYKYNEKVSYNELIDINYCSRRTQLSNYFKTNFAKQTPAQMIDSILGWPYWCFDNHPEYVNVVTIIYNCLKDKRKLVIALDIVRTMAVEVLKGAQMWDPKIYLPLRAFPYELDAVASGIQMTALLLKDQQLAEWSNLMPNPHGQDLYTTAGKLFQSDLKEALNYNINILKPNDISQPLEYYIPRKCHWFIKREASKRINKKSTINDYISIFKERQQAIQTIFNNYPLLLNACSQRDLWKKSIMTFGYNSTTKGRVEANIAYFQQEANVIADHNTIVAIANLVEDHFKWVVQPTLTPAALKMKLISKILANSLQSKNVPKDKEVVEVKDKEKDIDDHYDSNVLQKESKHSLQIRVDNEFLTHIIQPPRQKVERVQTNSYKGPQRGYQVNIALKHYDSAGNLILDHSKAELLCAPNIVHSMDAYLVHQLYNLVEGVSPEFHKKKLTKIRFTSTHDSFGFVDTYFAKSLLELAYLCTHKRNYITCLKANPNYHLLRPIVSRKYVFSRKKQRKYDLLNTNVTPPKIYRQLQLKELGDSFVK